MTLISKAFDLKDAVEYSGDSVVSKTILDKSVGTVTLFAFDKGQGLSEHTAPFDALVYILDGKAVLTIGGETVTAGSGQMVIMPTDVPHSVKAEEKFKMMLVMIRA